MRTLPLRAAVAALILHLAYADPCALCDVNGICMGGGMTTYNCSQPASWNCVGNATQQVGAKCDCLAKECATQMPPAGTETSECSKECFTFCDEDMSCDDYDGYKPSCFHRCFKSCIPACNHKVSMLSGDQQQTHN
mmetsp:Transcript_8374/g.16433  ORF Transcript_8374/g.16433 Transcript_8374/m.16433 type:complete len:136 (+) Transcript_8374:22-429(+)